MVTASSNIKFLIITITLYLLMLFCYLTVSKIILPTLALINHVRSPEIGRFIPRQSSFAGYSPTRATK
ncbi:hypothetical protein PUN28_014992 [Cardiocondyla obscurior]|uniref:ATP synthase F0 subunit 8 n=1 Tax=Cardiocondyla obscurior TaxID=286306 RepID=A0AAW2EWE7_9HYME